MIDVERFYSSKIVENFFNFQNFEEINNNANCIYPGWLERIIVNYFFFIIPFFIGVNFTHFNNTAIKNFDLNPQRMKENYTPMMWLLLIALSIFILLNLAYHFYNYAVISLIKFGVYIIILFGIIATIAYGTYLNRQKKVLHIHHFNLMSLLLIFVNVHCIYDLILFGLLNGIMVEGAARWGIRSIWENREKDKGRNIEINVIMQPRNNE